MNIENEEQIENNNSIDINLELLLKIKQISESRHSYLVNMLNEIDIIETNYNINLNNSILPTDTIECKNEVDNYLIKQNFIHFMDKKQINTEITNLNDYIATINEKIKKLCKHELIDDYIDINMEQSQNITYCSICNLTFD